MLARSSATIVLPVCQILACLWLVLLRLGVLFYLVWVSLFVFLFFSLLVCCLCMIKEETERLCVCVSIFVCVVFFPLLLWVESLEWRAESVECGLWG